jgi:hypothetical protein
MKTGSPTSYKVSQSNYGARIRRAGAWLNYAVYFLAALGLFSFVTSMLHSIDTGRIERILTQQQQELNNCSGKSDAVAQAECALSRMQENKH